MHLAITDKMTKLVDLIHAVEFVAIICHNVTVFFVK